MIREPIVIVCTCEIAGKVRGKGFPLRDLPNRRTTGVGWLGTNGMISALGPIANSPFGATGALLLVPDPAAEFRVDFADGAVPEHFFLGDVRFPDGTPWLCCPRDFLRRALTALDEVAGLRLIAAFEHEFMYDGVADRPGAAYSLDAWRRQDGFGSTLVAALRAAGIAPDTFLPEFGARQFEITCDPAPGLRAADEAVALREIVRATAHRLGHRASFTPIADPAGVGNGVHVHFSFRDAGGRPVTHDPAAADGLSPAARQFCAGIMHHAPALLALTAPAPVSYIRLRPNRWAPVAATLAAEDRSASLRVCVPPAVSGKDPAAAFNVEFRAVDAAASPYLALGAMVWAGVDGIRRGLAPPAPDQAPAFPTSLAAALQALAGSAAARGWMGEVFHDAYLRHKRAELAMVADLDEASLCARYADVY